MERSSPKFNSCGICLIAAMLLVHYVDLSSTVITREYCSRSENLTFAPCQSDGLSNVTWFPNFLGHQTMEEAVRGFQDFYPYLEIQCSSQLQRFLCFVHFPRFCEHLSAPVFPCAGLCERVQDECEGAFRRAGATWPDDLDCNNFVRADNPEGVLCIEDQLKTEDEGNLLTTAATPPTSRLDPSARCQPLPDDHICQSMPYSTVIYPNIAGQRNHSDALVQLHRYSTFMKDGGPCSDLLRTYLCLVYLPPCKIVEEVAAPIPPCRAFCNLVLTDSCTDALAAFKMELPPSLSDCNTFPKQSDSYPTCFMPGAKYDPLVYWFPPPIIVDDVVSHCKADGCEDVLHGKCWSLDFWLTNFPNILGHTAMREALDELDRLEPFINSGCSDKLQIFACYGFFITPSLTAKNPTYSGMPCQSVCQEIWKSCRETATELFEKRPRLMTCRLYPTENCDPDLSKHPEPITIHNASRVNATHAIVGFNRSSWRASYDLVAKWGVEDKFIHGHKGNGIVRGYSHYFELFDLLGYHLVFWPWNVYGMRGKQPTVAWIPPYNIDTESLPDHCKRVDFLHCDQLGYTSAEYVRESYWYWDPPKKLLNSSYDYFTEEMLQSGDRCLPRLHELLCGLFAPPCTSSRQSGPNFPCREFCENVLNQCNTSSHEDLGWLLESLECDRLLSSSQGSCIRESMWDPSEAVLVRSKYQYNDESVRVYCLVNEDRATVTPEFYDPEGRLLSVTSPNASGRQVIELSPRLTMLYFEKVPFDDIGTYTCKAARGKLESTTDIRPLVKCTPALNHTLCAAFAPVPYVQIPNVLGHTTQYQAEIASYNFLPLLATGCSSDLLELVCALYCPQCSDYMNQRGSIFSDKQPLTLPSQGLCHRVTSACADAAVDIGFQWPSEVQCDKMTPDILTTDKEHVGPRKRDCINLRRYDITDLGVEWLFYGWVDVQGQGAANDYCRVVSVAPFKMLSCALAGTQGENQYNYNSSNSQSWLDLGHTDTWYMRDQDGDGRDDYCRCVGAPRHTTISCLRAGLKGFEDEFTPEVETNDCRYAKVNKLFGV